MNKFRDDINALRAIAIVSVVCFHFHLANFVGGFGGVDVFFVVSGFLMTSIIWGKLQSNKFSLRGFYAARAIRIVPALLFVCSALLVFGWFWLDPLSFTELGKETVSALFFFSNARFLLQSDYFDSAAEAKILLHTWSLSVEWQFYLLYPVLLMILHRFAREKARWLLAACALLSFAFAVSISNWKPEFDFYMLPSRAWEMALGGIAYFFADDLIGSDPRRAALLRPALALVGFTAIVLSFFLIDSTVAWPAWATLAPTLGATAVIAANHRTRLFSNGFVNALGRWSYSIYLWHWPVLIALGYFDANSLAFRLAALAPILILSALSYRFIEQASQRFLTRPDVRGRRLAVSALLVTVATSFAVAVDLSGGLRSRFNGDPAHIARIVDAANDWKMPENCRRLREGTGDFHDCQLGHGDKKIMLFGDSFAAQLYPRMAELAKAHPEAAFHFATVGGCPPLPNVDIDRPGAACRKFTAGAMHEALTGHYDVLIVASVWSPYFMLDSTTIDKEHNLCFFADNKCRRPKTSPALRDAFQSTFDQLSDFVAAMRAGGAKVILVLPTPMPPQNTRDFPADLVRRAFLHRDLAGMERIDLAEFRKSTDYIRRQLAEVALKTGAILYDPAEELCSATECPVLGDDNIPIYTDNSHLRASFIARAPLKMFDSAIFPLRAEAY